MTRRLHLSLSKAALGAVVLSASVALSATSVATADAAPSAATTQTTLSRIEAEANWIERAQIPGGAIGIYPASPGAPVSRIEPYLGNIAAAGLVRATGVSGHASYAARAWSYLQWYSSVEQHGSGYVTDYTVAQNGTLVSTGTEDSTDAYAGTYLTAAWDAYAATSNKADLHSIAGGVAGALHAVKSTQQADGLTWATPAWPVAYLMDNAEAHVGLVAAGRLEEALGHPVLAAEATTASIHMKAGIASLWNPSTGAYDWAVQPNGAKQPTDWRRLYPDALEQMSAVAWGVVPPRRAALLTSTFVGDHPKWDVPSASDNFLVGSSSVSEPVGYQMYAAVGLDMGGKPTAAEAGMLGILGSAASSGYAWPFTPATAGQAIQTLSGRPALDPPAPSTTSVRS